LTPILKYEVRLSAQRQPIFNAPLVVVVVLGVLIAVHALRQVIDDETALWWTVALAFVPARFFSAFTDIPGGSLASVTSFLTHALVHGDAVHLAINSAWLLAFGSAVARRVGSLRFLALFAASAIAGAALYLAFNTDSKSLAIMVGASGAISGLVGGAFRFFFRALEADDPDGLSGASNWVPTMSLMEMARDRQARVAVIAWLVLNLVFAVLGPLFGWASSIAWEAHLGGFLLGLLAFPLFDRMRKRPDGATAD
jgi:membrane associated rhomboid family serine protease